MKTPSIVSPEEWEAARQQLVPSIRRADNTISTPTTRVARAFSHRGFVRGPSTARSLHKSKRNTVAPGSKTPASACTPTVTTPRGAPGISTTAAAIPTQTTKLPWNAGASRHPRCSECLTPNTSPIAYDVASVTAAAPSIEPLSSTSANNAPAQVPAVMRRPVATWPASTNPPWRPVPPNAAEQARSTPKAPTRNSRLPMSVSIRS